LNNFDKAASSVLNLGRRKEERLLASSVINLRRGEEKSSLGLTGVNLRGEEGELSWPHGC